MTTPKSVIALFAIAVVGLAGPSLAFADTVVPGSLTAVDGDTNNSIPFGGGWGEVHYQQVYDASEFGLEALLIDAVSFRLDSEFASPFSSTYSDITVSVSTTTREPDNLSTTFADNLGFDNTVVRTGPITLSSSNAPGPGNTRAFDITIPFTVPFLYDPTLGNLLLDIQKSDDGPFGVPFDAHFIIGDSISRVFSTQSVSGRDTTGLVTQFQTQSTVPDIASSLSLLMLSMGGVLVARRRMRR